MESMPNTADVIRKVLLLSLFGFLALILAGPVIAIASVLLSLILSVAAVVLPFFLVGILLWLPFQGLILGRRIEWGRIGNSAKVLFGGLFSMFTRVFGGSFRLVRGLGSGLWSVTRFVSVLLLDTLGGALVGAVLGAVGGMMHGDADGRIPMGALIGAGVGVVVGLARSREKAARVVMAEEVKPERPRTVVHGLRGCVELPCK